MTTLQKIKELLELGYEVEVEYKNQLVNIFCNREGHMFFTGNRFMTDIAEEHFNNAKILRIIPKKPKLLEVGRKVKVITTGLTTYIDKAVNNRYFLIGCLSAFNPHEVIPVYDEEEVQETIEIAGRKYVKSEFEKAVKDLKEVK